MNKRDAILSLCLGKVLSTKHDDITSLYYMTSQGDIYKAKKDGMVFESFDPNNIPFELDLNSVRVVYFDDLSETGWRIEFDNEKSS